MTSRTRQQSASETLLERVRARPMDDDPNRLPLDQIPEEWRLELLRWAGGKMPWQACLITTADGNDYGHFDPLMVFGRGPTPRAAVLAAIEKIGK